MKSSKVIAAALILMMSAVFAMSGDGGQQPANPEKKTEAVQDTQQTKLSANNEQEKTQLDQGKQEMQAEQAKSNETVKDQFGIDTGMTKGELEKFKGEYLNCQEKNKIYKGERTYFTKVNILEMDKLKKFNINLNATLDACNINDYVIQSELIIIGSHDSFEIDEDRNSTYPVTYKIKVDEILTNATEYENLPSLLIVKGDNMYKHSVESLSELLKKEQSKNQKYVFFLSRYDFYYFKKTYEQNRKKTYVKDDCFEPYVFTYLQFSRREIKDNKIAIDPYKSDLDEDNWLDIKELKSNIKEIIEINDRENFYKRSYK